MIKKALLFTQLGKECPFLVSSDDADLRRKHEEHNDLIFRGAHESKISSRARGLLVCYVVTC